MVMMIPYCSSRERSLSCTYPAPLKTNPLGLKEVAMFRHSSPLEVGPLDGLMEGLEVLRQNGINGGPIDI